MRPGVHNRSSLFLIELIIAILFFSVSSAICLRIFAKAHQMSTETLELQHAVTESSNVSELVRYDLSHDSRQLLIFYPHADVESDSPSLWFSDFRIYYDSAWNPCESSDSSYLLSGTFSVTDDLLAEGILSVNTADDSLIYELPVKFYLGPEARHE